MLFLTGNAQHTMGYEQLVEKSRDFRVMFYNCENYFDTINDPIKNDDQFTPEGSNHWSSYKFYKKKQLLSKAIIAVGGWRPSDIVGLCEIENLGVLEALTKGTALYKYNYQIAHFESPDKRGIDVALLYNEESFQLLSKQAVNVSLLCNFDRPTRDILYVKGVAQSSDTLHVFVNHWPSRWGGQLESESKRVAVATALKNVCDSIYNQNNEAKIIIMGDLNDEASDKSIQEVMLENNRADNYLVNTHPEAKVDSKGTHKYQGKWANIDHFIVSKSLLNPIGIHTTEDGTVALDADFLMETDEKHLGIKPFRTFIGFRYNGGYSDHLPIFIDFHKANTPK